MHFPQNIKGYVTLCFAITGINYILLYITIENHNFNCNIFLNIAVFAVILIK